MCGISGAAGGLEFSDEKVAKTLLIFNAYRGEDSTGIASVKRSDRNIVVAKELGDPRWLFDTKRFDKVFTGSSTQYSAFIGHNRHATKGDKSRTNAHPFLILDGDNDPAFVGVHNGSLDHSNLRRMKDHEKYGTDSEALLNDIYHYGAEETVANLDKDASYALAWYDSRDNTINLLRNDHRPLYYTVAKEGKTLYWSSEVDDLKHALARCEVKADKMMLLNPNTWMRFELPDQQHKKLPEPVRRTLKNFKPSEVYKSKHSYSSTRGGTSDNSRFFPSRSGWKAPQQETATETPEEAGKGTTSEWTLKTSTADRKQNSTTNNGSTESTKSLSSDSSRSLDLRSGVDGMEDYLRGFRDPEDNEKHVYGGPLIGLVLKSTPQGQTILAKAKLEADKLIGNTSSGVVQNGRISVVQRAVEAVRNTSDIGNKAANEDLVIASGEACFGRDEIIKRLPVGGTAMQAADVFQKRQYEEADKAGLIPGASSHLTPFRDLKNIKVWRNKTTSTWTWAEWDAVRGQWEIHNNMVQPPTKLPFTILDPEAGGNHCFIHEGKQKKGTKKIFFKGFNGYKLDMDKFNNVCRQGCTGCSREPEWGNPVSFFSIHHEFLCEYCMLTPGFFERMKHASTPNKQVA